jgi:serine/threonine protein kinase
MSNPENLLLPPHVEIETKFRNLDLGVFENIEGDRFQIISLIRPAVLSELSTTGSTIPTPRAEIYEAMDWQDGRKVAIKVFHENSEEASHIIDRQLAAHALLQGAPRIIETHGMGTIRKDGTSHRYVATELSNGGDFNARIKRGRRSLSMVVEVAAQIAEGLESIHDQGLVHKDIKPSNVLLSTDGAVISSKLTDFEIVEAYKVPGAGGNLAAMGTAAIWGTQNDPKKIFGTTGYIAPEYLRGGDVGPKVDVFALGVTIFNAATGELPFSSYDQATYVHAIANDSPVSIGSINRAFPLSLVELTNDLLSFDPDDRPTSSEAKSRLEDILDEGVPDVILEPMVTPFRKVYAEDITLETV